MTCRVTEGRAVEEGAGVGRAGAQPLAPRSPVLDLAHLARMTLGERALEHEVLALFGRQVDMLPVRMGERGAPPRGRARAYARGLGERYRRLEGR